MSFNACSMASARSFMPWISMPQIMQQSSRYTCISLIQLGVPFTKSFIISICFGDVIFFSYVSELPNLDFLWRLYILLRTHRFLYYRDIYRRDNVRPLLISIGNRRMNGGSYYPRRLIGTWIVFMAAPGTVLPSCMSLSIASVFGSQYSKGISLKSIISTTCFA